MSNRTFQSDLTRFCTLLLIVAVGAMAGGAGSVQIGDRGRLMDESERRVISAALRAAADAIDSVVRDTGAEATTGRIIVSGSERTRKWRCKRDGIPYFPVTVTRRDASPASQKSQNGSLSSLNQPLQAENKEREKESLPIGDAVTRHQTSPILFQAVDSSGQTEPFRTFWASWPANVYKGGRARERAWTIWKQLGLCPQLQAVLTGLNHWLSSDGFKDEIWYKPETWLADEMWKMRFKPVKLADRGGWEGPGASKPVVDGPFARMSPEAFTVACEAVRVKWADSQAKNVTFSLGLIGDRPRILADSWWCRELAKVVPNEP